MWQPKKMRYIDIKKCHSTRGTLSLMEKSEVHRLRETWTFISIRVNSEWNVRKNRRDEKLVAHSLAVLITWKTKPCRGGGKREEGRGEDSKDILNFFASCAKVSSGFPPEWFWGFFKLHQRKWYNYTYTILWSPEKCSVHILRVVELMWCKQPKYNGCVVCACVCVCEAVLHYHLNSNTLWPLLVSIDISILTEF